jgi:hypothetical protein
MTDEVLVLEAALKALTRRFDEFVGQCMDDAGKPRAPSPKALAQARACLPPETTKNGYASKFKPAAM